MNRFSRRRTGAKGILFVFLFLGLLVVPGWAQEEGAPTPVPQTETVEAKDTTAPVQDKQPSPEATPKRPKTVGEALNIGGSRSPEEEAALKKKLAEDPNYAGNKELDFSPEKVKQWEENGEVGQSTFFDKLISVTWSLALISFLIWLSAKIAGKAGVKQLGIGASPKSLIQIIERKRLSPGRSILLMQVGPKVLAVAATEKGYETLTEFEQDDFKQYMDALPDNKKPDLDDTGPPEGVKSPADIARHYLSILPGTGAKK